MLLNFDIYYSFYRCIVCVTREEINFMREQHVCGGFPK